MRQSADSSSERQRRLVTDQAPGLFGRKSTVRPTKPAFAHRTISLPKPSAPGPLVLHHQIIREFIAVADVHRQTFTQALADERDGIADAGGEFSLARFFEE